ncbi:MAG TPA: hypothetical protein PLV68_00545, partial [Ilumatobacteraceae bacterium]|nr:hypothetical protein [Ilumatobacteraceae bacterium]
TSGWKTWDTLELGAGHWTTTNPAGGTCVHANCTWAQVLAQFPNATINNPTNALVGRLLIRGGDTSTDTSAMTLHTDM